MARFSSEPIPGVVRRDRSQRNAGHIARICRLVVLTATVLPIVGLPSPISPALADDLQPLSRQEQTAAWQLRDVWKMDIVGNEHFSDQDIRQALALDGPTLGTVELSRPLEDFDRTVAERIIDGYRRSGFLNARVTCLRPTADQRATVQIKEGQRYTCDRILFAEHESIDTESIAAELRAHRPSKEGSYVKQQAPLWHVGEPVTFSAEHLQELAQTINKALHHQRFLFADCHVELVPRDDDARADLQVTFSGDLRQNNIRQIAVRGLSRNSQDEVLEFLSLTLPVRDSHTLRDRIATELLQTARFVTVDFDSGIPLDADDAVPLTIAVREYEKVPKLTEPLSETQQAAQKIARWVSQWSEHDTDIQVLLDIDLPARTPTDQSQSASRPAAATGPVHLPDSFAIRHVKARLTLSSTQGGILDLTALNGDGHELVDHSLLLTQSQSGLVSWNHQHRWLTTALQGGLSQNVVFEGKDPDEQGRQFRFGFNLFIHSNADKPLATRVAVNPAMILDYFLRDNKLQLNEADDGQSVVLQNGDFDRQTGQVRTLSGQSDSIRMEFRSAAGLLASALQDIENRSGAWPNFFRTDHGCSSLLAYIANDIDQTLAGIDEDLIRLLLQFFKDEQETDRLAQVITQYFTGDRFRIPAAPSGSRPQPAGQSHWALPLITRLVPPGTTPFRLSNALIVAREHGDTRSLQRLVREIIEDDSHGPVDCLLTAILIPGLREQMAGVAEDRMSTARFLADLDPVISQPCVASGVMQRAITIIQQMDDRQATLLLAVLNRLQKPSEQQNLVTGLSALISHIRSSSEQDAPQILRQLLGSAWDLHLRQATATFLQPDSPVRDRQQPAQTGNPIRAASTSRDLSN